MVSSIVPGAAGAGALDADTRFARGAPQPAERRDETSWGDRVELSGAALAAARESVRAGIAQAQHALAIGHDAHTMLVGVQTLLRSGGADAQAELEAAMGGFSRRVEAAVAQGAILLTGEDIQVQAEPGSAPLTIGGVDLRLKATPGDIIAVAAGAVVDDAGLPQSVQRSIEALQTAMGRLLETVQALEAHQGFIGAAESAAAGVRHDLDADGARLLSLQVRQGLAAIGAAPIANVEPRAVLALFRA